MSVHMRHNSRHTTDIVCGHLSFMALLTFVMSVLVDRRIQSNGSSTPLPVSEYYSSEALEHFILFFSFQMKVWVIQARAHVRKSQTRSRYPFPDVSTSFSPLSMLILALFHPVYMFPPM